MTNSRLRAASAAIAALLLALLLAVSGAPRAAAAGELEISQWNATYTVQESGRLHVVEKLTYHFFTTSSHGIFRGLVTRESWTPDSSKDRTYDVSVESVTADQPVSTSYTTYSSSSGSTTQLMVKVGDANQTISQPYVTYTITYDVDGAITSNGHGDELYWDVVPGDAVRVAAATVTVQVPKGPIADASCYQGPKGSSTSCPTHSASDATASFSGSELGNGNNLTTSVTFPTGVVANNQPTLVPSKAAQARQSELIGAGATGGTLLASIAGLLVYFRRGARDKRFLGLPPGIMPAPGDEDRVGLDDKPQIPVAFSPPRITPGEAGLLVDGAVDIRDTTATLVDLAVRGALKINAEKSTQTFDVVLVDPAIATLEHEQVLIKDIFEGIPIGTPVDLSGHATMLTAHNDVRRWLLDRAQRNGWYERTPSAMRTGTANAGCIVWVIMIVFMFPGLAGFASAITGNAGLMLAPVIPIVIALAIWLWHRRRGRRSAVGRALTDQVVGFQTYLATAEADQIRFEEGEDIFSKYLPWAIAFNLTDRWTKICERLVQMGRIPDAQPAWYYGTWYGFGGFDPGYISSSVQTAATPEPSSSSGSGGSGFGGGGFSGGGGGGGSAGGW